VTQALISGELYEKPTVPIEHTDYPDDYDLELNIGVKDIEKDGTTAFVVAGMKNYLVRPCNDAVFLKDVSVDWISPKGDGQEIESWSFDASGDEVESEIIEEATERAKEFVDEYEGGEEPGL